MRKTAPAFEPSSGNVFADLGFEHPEEELAKAQLILQIVELVRARGLTQTAAARVLALPQPKVSLLLRGQMAGFSTDRLIRLLNRLDQDVEIVVRAKASARRPAHVRVIRQGGVPIGRRRKSVASPT
jgi:predicted XRE-type DNA-binding protein